MLPDVSKKGKKINKPKTSRTKITINAGEHKRTTTMNLDTIKKMQTAVKGLTDEQRKEISIITNHLMKQFDRLYKTVSSIEQNIKKEDTDITDYLTEATYYEDIDKLNKVLEK